jgi:cell wall-associated NlpC family hydrolase
VKKGIAVKPEDMQVGDIVFFDTYKKNGHVGIYVGNGKFIGAQSKSGVSYADMSSGYFKSKFSGVVRRVKNPNSNERTVALDTVGDSNYNNYWKTNKESKAAKGFKPFQSQLSNVINKGQVPREWATALTEMAGRESTWNPRNDKAGNNSKSTAWGYAQFLDSTRKAYKRRFPHLDYNKPEDQIVLMYQYIKDRYKTPWAALKFWDKKKWY